MPPKKKPGSGKKKKAAKASAAQGSADALDPTEKLKKASLEMETLSRELEIKSELNERLREQLEESKAQLRDMETYLMSKTQDRLDLTSDMSRQYKSMQTDMVTKINSLEAQVADLKAKLGIAHMAIQEAAREHSQIISEKDLTIEDQNMKMTYMSNEFESMLNETLVKLAKKLEVVSERWKETDGIHLSDENQRRLSDFHLSRATAAKFE